MNYVIVSGFICLGSSVVNDLLKEVCGYKDFPTEFKLFREPKGIIDLAHYLVEDWDYMKSGDAILDFIELSNKFVSNISTIYSYDKVFNQRFLQCVEDFINRIVYKNYECGSSFYTFEKQKILNFKIGKGDISYEINKPSHKNIGFSYVTFEEFNQYVKDFMNSIFGFYTNMGYSTVILDQGLPPGAHRYIGDFFKNGKMFIIDRDPRDTALSMIQRNKAIGVELKNRLNVDFYTKWFQKTRAIDSVNEKMLRSYHMSD